jgi:ABC-type sulfate transport system permease component
MATKTSHLSAPAYKTPNQPGNPAHTDWLSQKLSESWKLLALPLLLFITIPLIAIFLRTSVGAFFTDLNQTQVIQAFSLSLLTSLTTCFPVVPCRMRHPIYSL